MGLPHFPYAEKTPVKVPQKKWMNKKIYPI